MAKKHNTKDDFFASDYDEFENNKNEFPEDDYSNKLEEALNEIDSDSECQNCPDSQNCPDENDNVKSEQWNLQLTAKEINTHRFMISTLDPLIKKLIVPVEYYDTMAARFVKTFEQNAGVLPGHRNS